MNMMSPRAMTPAEYTNWKTDFRAKHGFDFVEPPYHQPTWLERWHLNREVRRESFKATCLGALMLVGVPVLALILVMVAWPLCVLFICGAAFCIGRRD